MRDKQNSASTESSGDYEHPNMFCQDAAVMPLVVATIFFKCVSDSGEGIGEDVDEQDLERVYWELKADEKGTGYENEFAKSVGERVGHGFANIGDDTTTFMYSCDDRRVVVVENNKIGRVF